MLDPSGQAPRLRQARWRSLGNPDACRVAIALATVDRPVPSQLLGRVLHLGLERLEDAVNTLKLHGLARDADATVLLRRNNHEQQPHDDNQGEGNVLVLPSPSALIQPSGRERPRRPRRTSGVAMQGTD